MSPILFDPIFSSHMQCAMKYTITVTSKYMYLHRRVNVLCTIYSRLHFFIMTDLLPGTSYYMRVAAMTLNGTGPFTTWLTHSTLPLPGN